MIGKWKNNIPHFYKISLYHKSNDIIAFLICPRDKKASKFDLILPVSKGSINRKTFDTQPL